MLCAVLRRIVRRGRGRNPSCSASVRCALLGARLL
jgi:hypothetical protein